MDGAAADAAVPPVPTAIAGEPASGSGDHPVDRGDVDTSKVAAAEVSAHGEAEASCRNSNGERRSAIHTFLDALTPSHISLERYLTLLSSSPRAGTVEPDPPSGELTKDELLLRAVIMFLGGKGHPGRSGRGSAATVATNALAHLARAVVFELYDQQRAEVRWLNETQQLDQEEALAYLLADVLDYELLAGEARAIGDVARRAAVVRRHARRARGAAARRGRRVRRHVLADGQHDT